MRTTRLRRTGALLTAAALLATMTAATVAAPTTAAKPRCAGKVATIVGTKKSETIVGTKRADVIVAKAGNDIVRGRGGNDTICGGPGRDTLYGDGGYDKLRGDKGHDKLIGGPGRDRLLGNDGDDKLWGNSYADWLFGGSGRDRLEGQAGNDALDGGPAVDVCRQGPGKGPRVRCERPAPKVLVIAYSDLNGNHRFDAGDVMISKIVDSNFDGVLGKGDAIKMGRYPTNLSASAFADWGIRSHVIQTVLTASHEEVEVWTKTGGDHWWYSDATLTGEHWDSYLEYVIDGADSAQFRDRKGADEKDTLYVTKGSPSRPGKAAESVDPGPSDGRFIDVEFYF